MTSSICVYTTTAPLEMAGNETDSKGELKMIFVFCPQMLPSHALLLSLQLYYNYLNTLLLHKKQLPIVINLDIHVF